MANDIPGLAQIQLGKYSVTPVSFCWTSSLRTTLRMWVSRVAFHFAPVCFELTPLCGCRFMTECARVGRPGEHLPSVPLPSSFPTHRWSLRFSVEWMKSVQSLIGVCGRVLRQSSWADLSPDYGRLATLLAKLLPE
jgi:hypothetical protein